MKPKRAVRYVIGYFLYHIQMIRMSPPRMLSVTVSAIGILTAINELRNEIGKGRGLLVVLLIVALYLLLIIRYPQKRSDKDFPRDLRYRVVVPATENQHKRIAEACDYFGDSAINVIDGAASIEADKYSTVALRDYKGREVGFADYYTFHTADALKYIEGRIPKRDFFADYYLPDPEARSAGALYISTVFRYDHISDRSAFGAKETAILAWCLIKLIETIQVEPEGGWLLFTAGGSDAGERLIRHYDLEDSGRTDPDGNRIYLKHGVTRADLAGGLKKFD
jgi:hypothetical protein